MSHTGSEAMVKEGASRGVSSGEQRRSRGAHVFRLCVVGLTRKINKILLELEMEYRAKVLDRHLVSRLNWYGRLRNMVVCESRMRMSW